jgi:hypothetical protein
MKGRGLNPTARGFREVYKNPRHFEIKLVFLSTNFV